MCHCLPSTSSSEAEFVSLPALQVLSTRARKGVIMSDIKVQVCLFAFDLLFLNGEQLLTQTLERRREVRGGKGREEGVWKTIATQHTVTSP